MPREAAPKPDRKTNSARRKRSGKGGSVAKPKPKSYPEGYVALANFVPKTDLAKRLWAIRLQIESAGGANLTHEEVLAKIRQMKGIEEEE